MNQEIDYDAIREQALIFDLWLDKCRDDPYELCPCGCEKKLRFAYKEGIDSHMKKLYDNNIKESICKPS